MKLDGRIDSSQDKKDVSHQKYDRPIQAGTKRGQSVAATVRSGLEDSPDRKSPPEPLGANDQKPQSPSGPFATKR
jgi:hypothetical protein